MANNDINSWDLMIRKLTGEATNEELAELDKIFHQHPDIYKIYMLLNSWKKIREYTHNEQTAKACSRLMTGLLKKHAVNHKRSKAVIGKNIRNKVSIKDSFSILNITMRPGNYFIIALRNISRQLASMLWTYWVKNLRSEWFFLRPQRARRSTKDTKDTKEMLQVTSYKLQTESEVSNFIF